MRIPDSLLEQWWTLIAEQPVPEGEPMEAKLDARPLHRRARSWGDEAADAAEEHFTRVVRRHEAPEDVPDVALPAGDPVHLPALLVEQMGVASTSRGPAPDPAGRGEAERRPPRRVSTCRAPTSRARFCRSESAVLPV